MPSSKGKDIKAGEHKITATKDDNSHYWACYSLDYKLIPEKNNYFQEYVSLDEGEIFVLMNATIDE